MKYILLTLLLIHSSYANEFSKYKKLYADNLEKIEQSKTVSLNKINEKYLISLQALLKKIQQTGDLDKTTKVIEAVKHFENTQSVFNSLDSLDELKKLELLYQKSISTNNLAQAKKILTLSKRYDQALEKSQKKYVVDGKLEEAVKIKNEREKLKLSETLKSAHAMVQKPLKQKTPTDTNSKREAIRPKNTLTKKEAIKLTSLTPTDVFVGWDKMKVNGGDIPMIDGKPCTDFIYAHANSLIRYNIPKGVKYFHAIACSPHSKSVAFFIRIDGKQVFKSRALEKYRDKTTKVKVKIPLNAKIIELVADTLGDANSDHSCWGYPQFTYIDEHSY